MKIAVPTSEGKLAAHFGHCSEFVFVEVDGNGAVVGSQALTPPAHAPGVLPTWLRENGADLVIAGGMGRRAQGLFADAGIQVIAHLEIDVDQVVAPNDSVQGQRTAIDIDSRQRRNVAR